jgi:Ca2+-transporting ATPase
MAAAAPWAATTDKVLKAHKVSVEDGLTNDRVLALREKHGSNELDQEDGTSLWQLVLDQFDDLLVKILLGAACLSFILAFAEEAGEDRTQAFVEPFVILLILIINAIVGVWQEHNAENALEALKNMQECSAQVIRDGVLNPELPASELVPGDIVRVRVGDKVPADVRVVELETTSCRTDEGALTGESETVLKGVEPVAKSARIQDKRNMLFSGTTVSNGTCVGIVVNTGMETEIGVIQAQVQQAATEEEKTPLGQKIDAFGELLAKVIAYICLAVWIMNYKQFSDPVHGGFVKGMIYYLKIAVALGVAAIPEGLPAVITLCLALGTRKMVKRNAIVRKLPSVETLGCTTVICSDKTGTLTTNQMTVVAVAAPSTTSLLDEFVVTGTSYEPTGDVLECDADLSHLARVCALCNQASIHYDAEEKQYKRVGEPTEAALRVFVEKAADAQPLDPVLRASRANAAFQEAAPRRAVLEFDRDRKSMSTLCGYASGSKNKLYVKGAPENVLERCTHIRTSSGKKALSAKDKSTLLKAIAAMASRPLRVLAMATREDLTKDKDLETYNGPAHKAHKKLAEPANFKQLETSLIFEGVCGIKDPARPEVKPALAACATAGIRVIMITGDTQPTAEAIAREIGLFEEGEDIEGRSFTGHEFFGKSEKQRVKLLTSTRQTMVFSRTEPKDKQLLVKMLRAAGEVPAMTGDGVNDAPALKQASIGIAMGISGTEVAKEASDMILADDNFATIVAAVEEGRSIYMNMKAFIRYMISSNIGEVVAIFMTALLGLPEGLIPVQLLWVNLATDGPPATALGFNPADADIMKKPPRRSDDELITPWVFVRYMIVGLYVGFATVGIFVYWYCFYDWSEYGQPLVSYTHLSHWGQCSTFTDYNPDFSSWTSPRAVDLGKDPCAYFTAKGKVTASTLSLSVLVVIEMLNALNALSEDGSLLQMPPWANPWLCLAMVVSIGLHFLILYVPWRAAIFQIVPLTKNDWALVMYFSMPVIFIDEALKACGRAYQARELRKRLKAE